MDALPEQYSQDYFKSIIKSGSETEIANFLKLRSEFSYTYSDGFKWSGDYGTYEEWCEIDNTIFRKKSERLKFELAKYCASIDIAKKILAKKDEGLKNLLFENSTLAKNQEYLSTLIPDVESFVSHAFSVKFDDFYEAKPFLESLFFNHGLRTKEFSLFFEQETFTKFEFNIQERLLGLFRKRVRRLNEQDDSEFWPEEIFKLPVFIPYSKAWADILMSLYKPLYGTHESEKEHPIETTDYGQDNFKGLDRKSLMEKWSPDQKVLDGQAFYSLVTFLVMDYGPIDKNDELYNFFIKNSNIDIRLSSYTILELSIKDAKRILKKDRIYSSVFIIRNPWLWRYPIEFYKLSVHYLFDDDFINIAEKHGYAKDNEYIYGQNFSRKTFPFQKDIKLWHIVAFAAVIYLFKNL